jgi:putative ABC transport system ATP-binding protein
MIKFPPVVHVNQLNKSYALEHGLVHALKNVNLTISKGESVAIMGASGSGKSTLLHLLGCLDRPTQGSYWLNQQDISHLSDLELAHVRSTQIGFVFQSFNLIPHLTVFENVEVPFLYQPDFISEEESRHRILQAITQVGLIHRIHHFPHQLSGGETQRVAIARALAIQPVLILADEPTGNLDTETGKKILQLFNALSDQGVTLVIVTHDEQVSTHCQRVLCMRDGEIITDRVTR